MLILGVADDGLDGGTALRQFFEAAGNTTLLALGEDAELVGVRCLVATIASIGENALEV